MLKLINDDDMEYVHKFTTLPATKHNKDGENDEENTNCFSCKLQLSQQHEHKWNKQFFIR